ncbi:MAG: hypothetical protein GXP18_03970 [Gammaproteobacteria bacterium]|nr:hypothetical protein [Gammaproteobacteria bacterium]
MISPGYEVKLPATMPNIENTPAFIKNNDGKTTTGQMQSTWFERRDCVKRGLLKLGLFWLLAAGSLPIIFVHWVLVPGFFLAGPWVAYRTYKTTHRRDHVSGICPGCDEKITIKLESNDELPKWTYCPVCNTPLHITSARQSL